MKLWHSNKRPERKRFIFVADDLALILGASALGAGSGILGGMFGKEEDNTPEFVMPPDPKFIAEPQFAETVNARENWGKTLTDWGSKPGYGADLSGYDDIYANAAKKINQYYFGSASAPGMMDKVKASAARRGVSESPAADVLMQRTGVEQANKLGDVATTLGIEKQNKSESARVNWLNSLMQLSQLRTPGTWNTAVSYQKPQQSNVGDVISTVGLGMQEGLQNYANMDWQSKELDKYLETLTNINRMPVSMPGTV